MRLLLVIGAVIAASISGVCAAEQNDELSFPPAYAYDDMSLASAYGYDDLSLRPTHADYALGVRRFRLEDGASRLVGWQLAEHWYFGKRRGDDDGFGLVWQGESTQVAITDEGISWRRRFSLMN